MNPRDEDAPDPQPAESEELRRQRIEEARVRAEEVRRRTIQSEPNNLSDLLPDLDAQLPTAPKRRSDAGAADEVYGKGFYTAPDVPSELPDPDVDLEILPRVRLVAGLIAAIATVAGSVTLFTVDGLWPRALVALALASGMIWHAAAPPTLDPPTGLMRKLLGRIEDLWDKEAASFYGIGTLATFIQLEVQTLLQDFAEAGGFLDFIQGEMGERVLGFSMQSIQNTIQAAMWPVSLFTTWSVLGMVGLGLGFAMWDRIHDWVDRLIRARNAERKRLQNAAE